MGCCWSCLGLDHPLPPINTEVRRPYGVHANTIRRSASVNSQNSTIDWYERRQQHLRWLEQNERREVSQPNIVRLPRSSITSQSNVSVIKIKPQSSITITSQKITQNTQQNVRVSRQPSSNLGNRLSARSTGTSSTRSQPAVKVVPRIEASGTKQRQSTTTSVVGQQAESGAKFGKYKCICGRFWSSRLCWPDKYQKCKKCKRPVYPYTYRELTPSDYVTGETDLPKHDKKLCQMCEQLGYSCLVFKRNEKQKRSQSETRVSRRTYYDSDELCTYYLTNYMYL